MPVTSAGQGVGGGASDSHKVLFLFFGFVLVFGFFSPKIREEWRALLDNVSMKYPEDLKHKILGEKLPTSCKSHGHGVFISPTPKRHYIGPPGEMTIHLMSCGL